MHEVFQVIYSLIQHNYQVVDILFFHISKHFLEHHYWSSLLRSHLIFQVEQHDFIENTCFGESDVVISLSSECIFVWLYLEYPGHSFIASCCAYEQLRLSDREAIFAETFLKSRKSM